MLDDSPQYVNSPAWQDMINKKRMANEMSFTARGHTQSPKFMTATFFNTKNQSNSKLSKSKLGMADASRTNSTKFMTIDSKNMTQTSGGVFGKTAGTMLNNDVRRRVTNWASNEPSLTQRIPDPSMTIRETNGVTRFPGINDASPTNFDAVDRD